MRGIIVTMGLEFPGKCSFVSSTVSYSSRHAIGALNVSPPLPAPTPLQPLQLQLQLQLQLGTAFVYNTYAIDLGYLYITFVSIPNIFVFSYFSA